MPAWTIFLMACACGLTIANIYYAQPLTRTIAPDVGLQPSLSSFIITLTQIGYCAGLLFLVPLGDRVEIRRLILATLMLASAGLFMAASAQTAFIFLGASLVIGVGSVAVQMIIPMAMHLSPPAIRGSVVGSITSGILTGIMLSRPLSGVVAHAFGWRAVFLGSGVAMLIQIAALRLLLPQHRTASTNSYLNLISSLWALLRDTPILRRRATYQAALFAAYTLFWTSVPFLLTGPSYGLRSSAIALFGLAAITGTIAAPLAGRMADAGRARLATGGAICAATAAFFFAWLAAYGNIAMLVIGAVLLDIGVWSNLVLGQRAIALLGVAVRSRLNALFMAIFFAGGAFGSACASISFTAGGWNRVCQIGIAFSLIALVAYLFELRRPA